MPQSSNSLGPRGNRLMFRVIERVKRWLGKSDWQNVEGLKVVESSPEQKTEAPILGKLDEQSAEGLKVRKPSEKPTKEAFQEQLDSLKDDETLQLWPPKGEYPGPVVINHPLILDGQGATIWAFKGPVLSIHSDGVSLRNLRIEVTGEEGSSPEDKYAILVKSGQDLQVDDVEVRGTVMGIPEEEGEWKYPQSLHLGQLAHGREYDLLVRIAVPVACKISSNVSGLGLEPRNLTPGFNEIRLHIELLPQDTLINGSIFLVSASLKRRITLTAHILSLLDEEILLSQNSIVWEPEDWSSLVEDQQSQSQSAEPEPTQEGFEETPPTKQFDEVSVPPTYPDPQSEAEQSESSALRQPKIRRGEQPNNEIFKLPDVFIQPQKDFQNKPSSFESPSIPNKKFQLGSPFLLSNQDNTTKSEVEVKQEPPQPQVPTLFLDQESQSQQIAFSQEEFPAASVQATPSSIPSSSRPARLQPTNNELFQQKPTPSEPVDKRDSIPVSFGSGRSQPINPIFNPTPIPSKSSDEFDEGRNQEFSLNIASQGNSQLPKRKIVRPNDISPLFGDSAKKEQPDKQQ